jgi:O-antigen/teichoic acid export membrane protein
MGPCPTKHPRVDNYIAMFFGTLQQARAIDWFDNEIIGADLGRKSFRGFSVTFGVQTVKFIVNMGGTAVLARLLVPDDFGLVAMIVSVTGVAHIFKDLGLSLAVVQRPRLTHEQASCLFWITIAMGLVTALIVALAGPLLALLLRDARLSIISPAVGLSFLFGAIGSQHQALLRRHMCFGTIGAIELLSGLLSYLVAIGLALVRVGYWALVFQQVSAFAFMSVISWILCSWRPGRIAWEPTVKGMIGFGGNLTATNLLNYLGRNLDNVLIGRFCGANMLGLYSKAYQLLLLPIWQINTPMFSAITPPLSRLQFEPQRFKQLYLKSMMAIVTVGMPLVVFMFVRAEGIVIVALGRDWIGAVPLFRLLSPAAFMDTFNIAGGLILTTLGQTQRQLRLSAASALILILGFCIGIRWGAEGVAIALSIIFCMTRIPALIYCFADSPVRTSEFLQTLWRPAICSLAAGALLFFVRTSTTGNALNLLLLLGRDSLLFVFFFFLIWIAIPRGWAILRETVVLMTRLIGTRRLMAGTSF